MDAKSLRIGNYVKDPNHNVVKVDYFTSMGATKEELGVNGWNPYEFDMIDIPITEEWLTDLGFDEYLEGIYYCTVTGECTMSIKIDDYQVLVGDDLDLTKTIKYVHQLQNLYFALTNEELTLKD